MITELSWSVTAGMFARGQFERTVRSIAHSYDLALKLEKQKGLLATTFYITMTGDSAVVDRARQIIKGLCDE
jgi:hypothetical protein